MIEYGIIENLLDLFELKNEKKLINMVKNKNNNL